jgi:hypothetical protein
MQSFPENIHLVPSAYASDFEQRSSGGDLSNTTTHVDIPAPASSEIAYVQLCDLQKAEAEK